MFIGLYLFMPILSGWLNQASKRDIKAFLIIWIISMCLPYLQMLAPALGYTGNYGNMGLLGVCDWNAYGIFYYFSGFLGYLVLAYYLLHFPFNWSWAKTLTVIISLFLIGYVITSGGFMLAQEFFSGDYVNFEIIWYFSSINVFMMTASVFIIIQKIKIYSSPLLSKIASLTFGIYLCHFVIVQLCYYLIYPNVEIHAFFKILLIAILTFALFLFVIWLLSFSKITRKVIM